MKFGEFIKKIRLKKGYSMREFSSLIGISASYMSDIEKSNRNLTDITKLNKIAKLLDINNNDYYNMMNLAGLQNNDVPPDIKLILTNSPFELYEEVRKLIHNRTII